MEPTAELLYDHEVLRGKLALLEEHLPALPIAGFIMWRLTDSLAACLRSHTAREEHLLASLIPHRVSLPAEFVQRLLDEHENQRTRLAILHALLTEGRPDSEAQIRMQAGELIQELREHMVKEEIQLFPLMDQGRYEREEYVVAAVDNEVAQLMGLA